MASPLTVRTPIPACQDNLAPFPLVSLPAQDIRVLRIKCLDMERELVLVKNSGGSIDEYKVGMVGGSHGDAAAGSERAKLKDGWCGVVAWLGGMGGGPGQREIFRLQREVLQEQTKVKALSEELENPMNIHRWRKLEGSDPATYEMIQKIQTLQKRLISKTEEVSCRSLTFPDSHVHSPH